MSTPVAVPNVCSCSERGSPRRAGVSRWIVVLLLWALSLPVPAQKSDQPPLVWQSNNETITELTREFRNLYRDVLMLDRQGRKVPIVTTTYPPKRTLTEVYRERGLFAGKDLPRQLDVFVCTLNPDACTVVLGASRDIAADDAQALWRISPGAPLHLPDLQFEPLILHKQYQKRAGDRLAAIVVDDRQGCVTYDDECQRYLQNLNRRLPATLESYAGVIVVPTKAYRTTVRITSPERQDDSRADLLKIAPELRKRVVPSVEALRDGDGDGSAATTPATRKELLKLIRHPLLDGALPAWGPHGKSNVVVFDNAVDKGHCLLPNIAAVEPVGCGDQVQRAAICGESSTADPVLDHGTHVAGLIGMRLGGSSGPGTNPYASIRVVCVRYDQFSDPTYLTEQADRLRQLYMTDTPDVVNLSFEYSAEIDDGRNDVFYAAINEQQGNTLFVVSAGNHGAELRSTSPCEVLPACYDGKNVVTVGALDASDDGPAMMGADGGGSNFGDRVHLAAPGQDILSTIPGDRVGAMSGTSQSAPIVAGAASLLYLYEPRLQPIQVKNRLIYTSDLFPSLFSKLQGGRLNVQRLLAFHTAQMQTQAATYAGSLVNPNQRISLTGFDQGPPLNLAWAQIRRLVLHQAQGHYTVFYNDEVGRDTGRLQRRLVLLDDADEKIAFRATSPGAPNSAVSVQLGEIRDYVSELLL